MAYKHSKQMNRFQANFLSGATAIYSGSTDLSDIFQKVGSDENKTLVKEGQNVFTGGTADAPIINVVDSPNFNNVSFSGTATGGNLIGVNLSGTSLFW